MRTIILFVFICLAGITVKAQSVQAIELASVNTSQNPAIRKTKAWYTQGFEIIELSYTRTLYKRGRADSASTSHITKFFVRKVGSDHGLVFDSLTALSGKPMLTDSVLSAKTILQVRRDKIYEKVINDFKLAQTVKNNMTYIDYYIPSVKTGPDIADTTRFYYSSDNKMTDIPFSLSEKADANKLKLYKIESVFNSFEGRPAITVSYSFELILPGDEKLIANLINAIKNNAEFAE